MLIPLFKPAGKRFVSRRNIPHQLIRNSLKTFNSVEVRNQFVKHVVKKFLYCLPELCGVGFYESLLDQQNLHLEMYMENKYSEI